MLGTRGCRLGILIPEIYEMQVRAIARAARRRPRALGARRARGDGPARRLRARARDRARADRPRRRPRRGSSRERDYTVGTMIELPRACLIADRIAEHADFFSFGTNDLTQTGLGFSRDDIEGSILGRYIELGIVDRSPFETIDAPGIGQLLRMGGWLGRKTKPTLDARRLRRARRRPGLDRVLPRLGHRLRVVLAVPRAGRAGRGRAGGPSSCRGGG